MGNSTSAPANLSLSLANAKSQIGKTFSGESERTRKSTTRISCDKTNPATKGERKRRHKRRERE